MGIKISDIWKVGTIAPLPSDLTEAGSMAIDVVGQKLYFLDNLGALFSIGDGAAGTVETVNGKGPDGAGNVQLVPSDIGAAAEVHTHAIADTSGLQEALDAKFDETEHIQISSGSADAGKPIILGATGQVDPSMITTNAFRPVSPWTPAAGTEYPDTASAAPGDFWWIEGVTEDPNGDSYTFVDAGGDLEGRTIRNGDFMVWGVEGWSIMIGEMNPLLYYKLDGTAALTANFQAGGHKLVNVGDGTSDSDGASVGQMNAANVLNLDIAGTRVMTADLQMGTLSEAVPGGTSNRVVGVSDALEDNEAANLGQVKGSFVLGVY